MSSAFWVHLLELEPFACSVCLMNDSYLYPVCVKLASSQYLFLNVDASKLTGVGCAAAENRSEFGDLCISRDV